MIQVFVTFLILVVSTGTLFILSTLNSVESEPKIIVYFQPATPEAEIFRIREFLTGSGKTSLINYINKQQAYEIYKRQAGANQLLIEDTSPDIFPPSLEIKAKNATYLEEMSTYLKKQTGVDEVQYQKATVTRLLSITSIIRNSVIIFVGYLALMTILILATMISFKIAMRKDEIEIFELLGATSRYITKPFFIESYIVTTFSVLVGCTLFGFGLWYMYPGLASYLKGIATLTLNVREFVLVIWPLNAIFISIVCAGTWLLMMIISGISTKIATQKYLI
ncbi:MAG: permease-like cell division protein FtsX [Candidatus Roizmanbacteria bacterium]